MHPMKATAHRAGALYFVFMIVALVREFTFPTFLVPGDAGATARSIEAALPLYRVGVLLNLVTLVMFIVLVALLYRLFREVDRTQAMVMVLLVVAGVTVALAGLVPEMAPVVLLGGAGYLSVFSSAQLDAMTLAVLQVHSIGQSVSTAFWGLWLFPFGILVIRSRFFPGSSASS